MELLPGVAEADPMLKSLVVVAVWFQTTLYFELADQTNLLLLSVEVELFQTIHLAFVDLLRTSHHLVEWFGRTILLLGLGFVVVVLRTVMIQFAVVGLRTFHLFVAVVVDRKDLQEPVAKVVVQIILLPVEAGLLQRDLHPVGVAAVQRVLH